MSAFPFLKLPYLAQELVVYQIDLIDIIELSMMSKKFNKVLQQVKITVYDFDYQFRTDSVYLFMHDTSSGLLSFSPTPFVSNLGKIRNIDGSNLQTIRKPFDSSYKFAFPLILVESEEDTNESKLKILEKLTKHLLSFLKVKNFQLVIRTNIDILNLFIWKYTKRFEAIYCCPVIDESIDITPDELNLFLENLTIDFLSLNVKIKNDLNFKYHPQNEGLSKIRKINIKNSDWLDYDNLLNMANESITCCFPKESSKKANEILKKWMSGTNEKLEYLKLWVVKGEKFVKEQVLNGTNAIPSVFTKDEIEKRSIWSPSFALPQLYSTMDIQREHDCCQTTLVLEERCIRLWVWNEKYLRQIQRI